MVMAKFLFLVSSLALATATPGGLRKAADGIPCFNQMCTGGQKCASTGMGGGCTDCESSSGMTACGDKCCYSDQTCTTSGGVSACLELPPSFRHDVTCNGYSDFPNCESCTSAPFSASILDLQIDNFTQGDLSKPPGKVTLTFSTGQISGGNANPLSNTTFTVVFPIDGDDDRDAGWDSDSLGHGRFR